MDDLFDDANQDRSRRLAVATALASSKHERLSDDGGRLARTTSRDTGEPSHDNTESPVHSESSRLGTRHRLFGRKRANSRLGDERDVESGGVMPDIPETPQTPVGRTHTFRIPHRSATTNDQR